VVGDGLDATSCSCSLVNFGFVESREKVGVGKITRKHFLRCKIIVESPLCLVPIMPETIPLASRLDVHVKPVVEDHGSIRMICNTVFAGSAPEGWLSWEGHWPIERYGISILQFYLLGRQDAGWCQEVDASYLCTSLEHVRHETSVILTSSSLPHIHAVSAGTSELLYFLSSSNVGKPLGNFLVAISILSCDE
jgi:hypothetical protein